MINSYINKIVKHVPYIWDGHGIKAFISLMELKKCYPDWDDNIWKQAINFIKSDEPQVTRLYHQDFKDLQEITDQTSGRNFGPRYLVGRGIFPLSYWGIWKLYEELGYEELIKSFLDDAVKNLGCLGHEVSIIVSYLEFYPYIKDDKELQLYAIERFTEFVSMSFAGREQTFPDIVPKKSHPLLLKKCLERPDFFGHNILAFVWQQKAKKYFNEDQQDLLSEKMNLIFDQSEKLISSEQTLTQEGFETSLQELILHGPKNVHSYTLAYALSYLWNKYPGNEDYKRLISQNVINFKKQTSVD